MNFVTLTPANSGPTHRLSSMPVTSKPSPIPTSVGVLATIVLRANVTSNVPESVIESIRQLAEIFYGVDDVTVQAEYKVEGELELNIQGGANQDSCCRSSKRSCKGAG